MSGIFSGEAWSLILLYKNTFFLVFLNTFRTAFAAILLAIVLGLSFGLMATSSKKLIRLIARIYVELIQNTPVILQCCFLYYLLAFSGHSLGIITTGIISLGIYTAAYMAEVIRAGIEAVPIGQKEAACSQGFNYIDRMFLIILPQTIKIILPAMANQLVNLIKNTSCLYIIGGADLISLTYSFVTGANTGGAYAPAYIITGLLFFIMCYPLSHFASSWENYLKRKGGTLNV